MFAFTNHFVFYLLSLCCITNSDNDSSRRHPYYDWHRIKTSFTIFWATFCHCGLIGLKSPESDTKVLQALCLPSGTSKWFRKIFIRYKRTGYNINVIRQTACLMANQITVNNFAVLFNYTLACRASDLMKVPAYKLSTKLVGARFSVFGRAHRGSTVGYLLLQRFSKSLAV